MAQFDTYKFDLQFEIAGFRASTAFYYRQAEADASNGLLIAAALTPVLKQILWTDYLKTILSIDCKLVGTRCQLYAPTKDAPSIFPNESEFGDDAGATVASATAQVITKNPGFWRRVYFGRNYIPGAVESNYTGGRIDAINQLSWQALADVQELLVANISTPETLSFDQVVFSQSIWKTYDPETQTPDQLWSLINSVVVQPILGTQRRRRPPRSAGAAP